MSATLNNKVIKQKIKDYVYKLKLANPIGGYPIHLNEHIAPFFIIGSGRCGTTLLRRILYVHPDVCIPPETFVLNECINLFRRNNNLPWKDLVHLILSTIEYFPKFVAFGISLRPLAEQLVETPHQHRSLAYIFDCFYHYYAQEIGEPCVKWGDKTPKNTLHLDAIIGVFPNAQFIHLIRNGVDVVHSYLRTGLQQGLHNTALRWKESVRAARDFGSSHPDSYYEIYYEELVENPEKITKNLCSFLGIEYIEGMVQNSETASQKMGDVPIFDHFSSVSEPISTRKIGLGESSFSRDQIDELRKLIGKELAELGYEL